MNLKVLLPSCIFVQRNDVTSIVAETRAGSLGILPHRLDCAAALVPGIVLYETSSASTLYIAVDEGVLVKSGPNVLISVRRAISSTSLGELQHAVKREFMLLDTHDREVRQAIEKMEAALVGRFAEFQRGR
jgi:F-type H+-transporting ATPase subunit epsilon